MIYKWKTGSKALVDAQVAGEEIERLRVHQNGRLEARDLVEASRDANAPLHPAFEWDNNIAAEKFRVEQAKYMIRSVEVVVQKGDEKQAPIRAFVSVVRDNDRSYTSTFHALSDSELRQQVVAQAWKELEAWQKRHAELVEFAGIFAKIEEARIASE
ncbi:hypothetical protein INR77_08850 [Erythrobacter sp. SCSIO 43205]|uniref:hypothetical protein n=1 Tax=Erythrobacter sp. SCSIO 43205 TaxID=2779361 RepID=UPI001CA7F7E0|nr:hypothetical protein [Erythrobacter sp. SCSIO 43205]UAB76955.1 hypothetical protein INR77_08850 [Erythrobacter sp. SCSIO 43205]